MHTISGTTDDLRIACATTPTVQQKRLLIAFLFFCVAAFVVAAAMIISSGVAAILLPHYGWPIIGLLYVFTLQYVIPPLLKGNPIPVSSSFQAIRWSLRNLALYGLITAAIGWLIDDDFGNPYLVISTIQPIWTIAAPLTWLWLFRDRCTSSARDPAKSTGCGENMVG
jgi:hypothetical protein